MCFFPFVSIDTLVARAREAEPERQRAVVRQLPQADARSKAKRVEDLDIGGLDSTGEEVTCFYGLKPPMYAVYRTARRVSVHFADDPKEADSQRKALAPLNPIRGEINGLIDGWRFKDPNDSRFRRCLRFDRRVGDALVVAFEDDVPDAAAIRANIKRDILDERIAWARFEYLLSAVAAGIVVYWATRLDPAPAHAGSLCAATAAGAVGAFFSIAIGIRGRTVLPDLLWLANTMDAIMRMMIGVIAAPVLMAIIQLKVFNFQAGMSVDADNGWLSALLVGFVAGFSERLVPDLLANATSKAAETTVPRRDADRQPAAGRVKAAAGATELMEAGKGTTATPKANGHGDIDRTGMHVAQTNEPVRAAAGDESSLTQ